jgi:drug/metabolite transporter (DMT)-like permease
MANCPSEIDLPIIDNLKIVPQPVSRYKIVLAYTLCALIWGTTWHQIRICIGPGGYPVFLAAALRFTIATIILAPFCIIFRDRAKLTHLWWIVLGGWLSGCGYGLIYRAEESLTGGLAAVIAAATTSLALTMAAVFKIEKNSWQAYVGSLLALVGIALTYHARMSFSHAEATAVLLMLAVAVLHAISNVVIKKFASPSHPLFLNAVYCCSAAIGLWVFAIGTSACTLPLPIPLMPTLALAYLALFGTLIALASFFYLLKHASLNLAMTIPLVTPLVALVVDVVVGEKKIAGAETYIGIAIVLSSVIANLVLSRRRPV